MYLSKHVLSVVHSWLPQCVRDEIEERKGGGRGKEWGGGNEAERVGGGGGGKDRELYSL